jgi:hypothetical protein
VLLLLLLQYWLLLLLQYLLLLLVQHNCRCCLAPKSIDVVIIYIHRTCCSCCHLPMQSSMRAHQ